MHWSILCRRLLETKIKAMLTLPKARRLKGFELLVLKKSRTNVVDFCWLQQYY